MPIPPRLSILLAVPREPVPGERDHLRRIHALYEALQAGRIAAVMTRLAPGIEWEEDRGSPGLAIRRRHLGRGAVARLLANPQGFPRNFDLVHMVESGDEVAALVAEGSAPDPDGVAALRLEAHLWTLDEEGLVTRFRQVAGHAVAPTRH